MSANLEATVRKNDTDMDVLSVAMQAASVGPESEALPTLTAEVLKAEQRCRGIQAPRSKSGVGREPAGHAKAR